MGTGARTAAIVKLEVERSLLQQLNDLAQKNEATLFMVLLSGLAAILYQRSSTEDMIIGTPAAGRMLPEFETMPGYFLNTLPLRIKVTGDMTFRELLRKTVRCSTDALSHQLYPFDEMVERFAESRGEDRNPLFDVMLILQNTGDYRLDLPNVSAQRYYAPYSQEAKFDIMIELENTTDGLRGIIEYNANVYHKKYIASIASDLVKTLEYIAHSPDAYVSSLFALFSQENEGTRKQFIQTISDVSEDF